MLPKGELEAFFLLLGGIYCSPLGTIKPASPAQPYALTSFILPKCIRLQQFYGLTKQDKKMPTTEIAQSSPTPPAEWVLSALFLHKGSTLERSQTESRLRGDP